MVAQAMNDPLEQTKAIKEMADALLKWSTEYSKKPVMEYREAFLAGNLAFMKARKFLKEQT